MPYAHIHLFMLVKVTISSHLLMNGKVVFYLKWVIGILAKQEVDQITELSQTGNPMCPTRQQVKSQSKSIKLFTASYILLIQKSRLLM